VITVTSVSNACASRLPGGRTGERIRGISYMLDETAVAVFKPATARDDILLRSRPQRLG